MAHTTVLAKKVFQSTAPYSQATRTSDGKWVQISGQVPIDEKGENVGVGDVGKQAMQALENMKLLVEAAGGQMTDICRMVVYVLDRAHLPAVMEARKKYFKAPYPANTAVIVSGLANADWLVEIEATAFISS